MANLVFALPMAQNLSVVLEKLCRHKDSQA